MGQGQTEYQCLKTGRESEKFRDTEKDKIFKCVIKHTRPIGHYKKFKSAGNGQRRRQMSKARETFKIFLLLKIGYFQYII